MEACLEKLNACVVASAYRFVSRVHSRVLQEGAFWFVGILGGPA